MSAEREQAVRDAIAGLLQPVPAANLRVDDVIVDFGARGLLVHAATVTGLRRCNRYVLASVTIDGTRTGSRSIHEDTDVLVAAPRPEV